MFWDHLHLPDFLFAFPYVSFTGARCATLTVIVYKILSESDESYEVCRINDSMFGQQLIVFFSESIDQYILLVKTKMTMLKGED